MYASNWMDNRFSAFVCRGMVQNSCMLYRITLTYREVLVTCGQVRVADRCLITCYITVLSYLSEAVSSLLMSIVVDVVFPGYLPRAVALCNMIG